MCESFETFANKFGILRLSRGKVLKIPTELSDPTIVLLLLFFIIIILLLFFFEPLEALTIYVKTDIFATLYVNRTT